MPSQVDFIQEDLLSHSAFMQKHTLGTHMHRARIPIIIANIVKQVTIRAVNSVAASMTTSPMKSKNPIPFVQMEFEVWYSQLDDLKNIHFFWSSNSENVILLFNCFRFPIRYSLRVLSNVALLSVDKYVGTPILNRSMLWVGPLSPFFLFCSILFFAESRHRYNENTERKYLIERSLHTQFATIQFVTNTGCCMVRVKSETKLFSDSCPLFLVALQLRAIGDITPG